MRSVSTLSFILTAMAMPFFASAATLSLDPAISTYGPGDTFITSVRIDPDGECINAAQIELTYPPSELRVVDVARGNSIFSLWVGNPKIDDSAGRISFSGGVPAGYCGRIPGDPVQSNVLGQIVFTVLKTSATNASVRIVSPSAVYLNDGLGTKAPLTSQDALYTLQSTPTQTSNPWVTELLTDTTAPEPFIAQVESTKDVFKGAYYAVFSTVDKQSGIDHYEMLENGVWKSVTSPHVLTDQRLRAAIQIKAIDKAGNERLGVYNASTTPARVASNNGSSTGILLLLGALGVFLILHWLWERRKREEPSPYV